MRIYQGKYLSVTSIIDLKDPFDDTSFKIWCERNKKDYKLINKTSKILGTKLSEALENEFHGLSSITPPPIDSIEEGLLNGLRLFLDEWGVLDCERQVICEELSYAGRLDLIAKNKKTGDKVLFDAKTFGAWKGKSYKRDSKKIKHTRWQTTLYANALKWDGDLGVVVFNGDGTFKIEYLKHDKEIIEWVKDNQSLILKVIQEENGKKSKKN